MLAKISFFIFHQIDGFNFLSVNDLSVYLCCFHVGVAWQSVRGL